MATRRTRQRRTTGQVGSAAANAKKRAREFSAFDNPTLELPKGVTTWYIEDAKPKRIDILAYKVGKGNPAADIGTYHYERTYYTHSGFGVEGKGRMVCLNKTYGEKCAGCEFVEQLKTDSDCNMTAEEIKKFEPKIRQIFNVRDVSSPNARKKGIQIWEFSFHKFGRQLDGMINDEDDDDNYHTFSDWIGGKTLKLGIEENKTYGRSVDRIEFKERKDYDPKILIKRVLCLDNLIKKISYEEQKKLIAGTLSDDQDEEFKKERDKIMKKIRKWTSAQLKKFAKANALDTNPSDFDDIDELREAIADEVAEAAMADEPEQDAEFEDEAPDEFEDEGTGEEEPTDEFEDEAPEEFEDEGTEEFEDEAPEEFEDEGDDLDAMDRTELKYYIRENALEVRVMKSMEDDDIRELIRQAEPDKEEGVEEEEFAPDNEEEPIEGLEDEEEELNLEYEEEPEPPAPRTRKKTTKKKTAKKTAKKKTTKKKTTKKKATAAPKATARRRS
jgi:hypothetical protein